MLKSEQNCTNCAKATDSGRFPPGCKKCSHRWTSLWAERNCDNCSHDAKDLALFPCRKCSKHGLGKVGASILWARKEGF